MKTKGVNAGLVFGIILAVAIGGILAGVVLFGGESPLAGGGLTTTEVIVQPDSAYTATINGFDNAADTRVEIYSDLFVLNQDGAIVIGDGVGVNSTSVAFNDVISVYPSGADYYCDPTLDALINRNPTIVAVECYTPAAETSLSVELFDSDMDTLNIASNGSDECNYNITLGEDQTEVFYSKLTNEDSDSVYQLGAVCGFRGGDISEMELKALEINGDARTMVEMPVMPKEIDDAAWLLQNDSKVDQTGSWDVCYVPADGMPIVLEEWDECVTRWTVTSDDDPTENTGDIFGVGHFDQSWNLDKNSEAYTGIDDGTDDGDVGEMAAIDEGDDLITPNDLNICASVEAL